MEQNPYESPSFPPEPQAVALDKGSALLAFVTLVLPPVLMIGTVVLPLMWAQLAKLP